MSDQWEKVDVEEFLRDVRRAETETYKLEGHSWTKPKRLPWIMCKRCGLVSLRNSLSAWCEKMGCLYKRHSSYIVKIRTTNE